MAPSMVVLLNTPLILLPMRLIPKDSPLFDVLLQRGAGAAARFGKALFEKTRKRCRCAWLR